MSTNIVNKWLKRSEVQTLIQGIPKAEQHLRFVGGCVRDAHLDAEVGDLDFATSYTPDEIIVFCHQSGFKVGLSGVKHGTVLAIVQGHPFEITTLRRDVETDGRHAKVEFSDDWLEDAKRRDFTFNSLYLSLDGTLFDPWNGLDDLKAGRVLFIGDPTKRIEEDYLRILRFFRFYARFGRVKPDAATINALQENADHLKKISGERIQVEILKLLATQEPLSALDLMTQTQVIDQVLGGKPFLKGGKRFLEHEKAVGLEPRPLARLYSLILESPIELGVLCRALKLSRYDQKYLMTLQDLYLQGVTNHEVLYRWGKDTLIDLALLENRPSVAQDVQQANTYKTILFPVKGSDLIELGIPQGPQVSKNLKELEVWWIGKKCLPNKEECLAHLRTL